MNERKVQQKKIYIRLLIYSIGIVLLLMSSDMVFTALLPSITSDVAMGQMKNSDDVYIEMRQHEVLKNQITLLFASMFIIWTGLCWYKPIRELVEKGVESLKGEGEKDTPTSTSEDPSLPKGENDEATS